MLRSPEIKMLTINGGTLTGSVGGFATRLSYVDVMSASASTLDLELIAEFSSTINVYDNIRIEFGFKEEATFVNTGECTIDRDLELFGSNMRQLGAQAYDYGLGIGKPKGSNTYQYSEPNSGFDDSARKETSEIKYGGAGSASATLFSAVITDIRNKFNLQLSTTTALPSNVYLGTAKVGFYSPEIVGMGYLDLLQKIAREYGYAFNLKPKVGAVNANGLLVLHRLRDLDNAGAVATITPESLIAQAEFKRDYSKAFKTVLIKYKSAPGDFGQRDTMIMTATDFRVRAENKAIADLRNEGYREDLVSAVARLEGFIQSDNNAVHFGEIATEGNSLFLAGKCLTLSGFNALHDGKYKITKATHSIEGGRGWTVQMNIEKIVAYNITASGGGGSIQYTTVKLSDWTPPT